MAEVQSESSAASALPTIPIEYIGDGLPHQPNRWPLRPAPMPDELLSSWLNRLAVANGMAPWSFYLSLSRVTGSDTAKYRRVVRQENRLKISEIHWVDFRCTNRLANYLAEHSGLDAKLIRGLALKRPSDASGDDRPPKGNLQWALLEAMPELLFSEMEDGERSKLHGYIRFCPHCMAEWRDPWFRKFWRTSLASVCVRHGCFLLPACSCGADVRPYLSKQARSQVFCYGCGRDLRLMKTYPAGHRELNRQREINQPAYKGVEDILSVSRSQRRIVQLMKRPTDHLCNLRCTGMIDAYATNSPITLLLTYNSVRRRGIRGRKRATRPNPLRISASTPVRWNSLRIPINY